MKKTPLTFVLVGLLMSLTSIVHAEERVSSIQDQLLATVHSDVDERVSRLVALVGGDDSSFKGIRVDTSNGSNAFTIRQIQAPSGVVLVNQQGYDAIIMNGSVDSKLGRGNVIVHYLASAFSSTYKTCSASVQRNDSGRWQLINLNTRRAVSDLLVRAHATGIFTIQGICQ